MTDAKYVITNALHLFGILDETEEAQPGDLSMCVPILNDMLRTEYMDGAVQYLVQLTDAVLPAGIPGQVYSFTVKPNGDVPVDAVAIKAIWANDLNNTVNRETRMAPMADVVRTTNPGIITKWHQRRQIDGSIIVNAWQPPRSATKVLIEYGGRVAPITAPESDVSLPPEGVHDATLLLGMTLCSAYGRSFEATSPLGMRAMAVDARWRSWGRGQQWLRFIRS